MASEKKNTKKTSNKGGAIINNEVGNYEKHPFFIRKANQAKAFLKKAGLPPQLVKKGA